MKCFSWNFLLVQNPEIGRSDQTSLLITTAAILATFLLLFCKKRSIYFMLTALKCRADDKRIRMIACQHGKRFWFLVQYRVSHYNMSLLMLVIPCIKLRLKYTSSSIRTLLLSSCKM